jgi:glycosyltransferase involved in cell wall biosynthesis
VIPSLYLGGAQTMCLDLCDAFSSQGHDVTLIVLFDGGVERFLKRIENAKYSVIFLHKQRGFSFSFAKTLGEKIKEINPDIIHTHLSSIAYVCYNRFLRAYPIFHTIHNEARKENNIVYRTYLKIKLIEGWNIKLIAISAKIGGQIQSLYHTKPIVIYNGASRPNAIDKQQKRNYLFVACGRLGYQKDYSRMLKSFAIFEESKTERTNDDKLLIIGDGEDMNKLLKERHQLNLDSSVVFYGYSKNPIPLLAESSIFLMTSKYEGNPISIIEAMSVGLPIISTNVGGISDVVNNKNSFLLRKNAKPKEIAKIMMLAANNQKWLISASEESKTLFENFTSEKMGNNYLSAFTLTLESR